MGSIGISTLVGFGALGSIYASRIASGPAGRGFRIMMDRARAERFERDGLFVNGRRLDVPVVTPESRCEAADLVIVAVKYRDLDDALEAVSGHVGPRTSILLPLNGLSSEETAAGRFGRERVLYSVASGVDSRREGNHITTCSPGVLEFGEAVNDPPSERVEAVRTFFERSDIACRVPADMLRVLWWKMMVNVGMNQTSAVLDAPYRVFQHEGPARDVMLAAQREVAAVARAEGIELGEDDIAAWLKQLSGLSPDGCSSSVQDIRMGRKTEVDSFGGVIVDIGRRHAIATPVNAMLVRLIHAIEETRELR